MKKYFAVAVLLILFTFPDSVQAKTVNANFSYWLVLNRKSNIEFLYFGIPDQLYQSQLLKIFKVKTGVPQEKPTPLPQLVGRNYWLITEKVPSDNLEVAPYFLTLDIPITEAEPFGPEPYLECNGQCSWQVPGAFGLHGINGDNSRLSPENSGSSGCVRHNDWDITYLYYLLDPRKQEIRYYIQDI